MDGHNKIQETSKLFEKSRHERIKEYITDKLSTDLRAAVVSQKFELSVSSLQHLFKKNQGQSYHHYLEETRMKKAFELIALKGKRIKEAMYVTGYKRRSTFNRAFKRKYNHPPGYFLK
ncbi:MAG: helix-turn-helix transcriptional regulator [Bacteroidota bacterium]|nr:helix-turn-helix transcriptional regulator [Bacteroidota bacterium]